MTDFQVPKYFKRRTETAKVLVTLKENFRYVHDHQLMECALIMTGYFPVETLIEKFTDCEALDRASYHPHTERHMIMIALNQLLECHGIEAIEHDDKHYSYVNMGDTYAATIIDNDGCEFIITDCGTFIEQLESDGVMCK